MDLDVRLACKLLHNILLYIYIYIRHSQANLQLGLSDRPAKPIYNWVYQAAANQANTLLGLSGYSAKPANSWVYQIGGSQANTVTFPQFSQHQNLHSQASLQLGLSDRQQIACTYINNTLRSTTNHQPSQHHWVYQAINNNTCTYINKRDHSLL